MCTIWDFLLTGPGRICLIITGLLWIYLQMIRPKWLESVAAKWGTRFPSDRKRIAVLENGIMDMTSIVKGTGGHHQTLTSHETSISKLRQDLSAACTWLSVLDGQVLSVVPRIHCLCRIYRLLTEADYCLENLNYICVQYPRSPVAMHPLDKSWRSPAREVNLDESRSLGIVWAEFLDRHLIRVLHFNPLGAEKIFITDTALLERYLTNLNPLEDYTALSGAECLTLLGKHKERLLYLCANYAAICPEAKVNAAMS